MAYTPRVCHVENFALGSVYPSHVILIPGTQKVGIHEIHMGKKSTVAIGIAVLVLIVVFVMRWSGGINTESQDRSITITLEALGGSGESGTATISEENGNTKVVLSLKNAPAGREQPAHIHKGSCPTPGEVIYPLSSVVNGVSETELEASTGKLRENRPLAINIHKSSAEASVYVACGNLEAQ